jgi:hypothetical protein
MMMLRRSEIDAAIADDLATRQVNRSEQEDHHDLDPDDEDNDDAEMDIDVDEDDE